MKYETYTASSGLRFVTAKTTTNTITVLYAVAVGSNFEKKGEYGIAHLLEHVIFEGTKSFKTAQCISELVEHVGGELNAATSKNQTMFYIKVPIQHAKRAIDVLSQLITEPLLTTQALAKEKEIVCREIDLYNDDPKHFQWQVFEKALFSTHPAKRTIAATKNSVSRITQKQLKEFHNTYYCAQNSVVVLVGPISTELKRYAYKKFSPLKKKKLPKHLFPIDSQKQRNKIQKIAVKQTYLMQGFIAPNSTTNQSYVFDILESLFSKGQSGWLFDECRNKRALAYDVRTIYDADVTGSFFVSNIITERKNITESLRILQELYDRVQTLTQGELDIAKTYLIGRFYMELENPLALAQHLAESTLYSLKEYVREIQKVSLMQVKRVAKKYLQNPTTIVLTQ